MRNNLTPDDYGEIGKELALKCIARREQQNNQELTNMIYEQVKRIREFVESHSYVSARASPIDGRPCLVRIMTAREEDWQALGVKDEMEKQMVSRLRGGN